MLVLLILMFLAAPVAAQQRPLATEDPETIGAGLILVEGGFDVQDEVFYPASGLTGDLLRLPTLGVSLGISSIAELQFDGGLHNRLNVTSRQPAPLSHLLSFTGDSTTDVEDLVVATKVRLLSENSNRPAIGMRLATRLPNAGNGSGLGLDTFDFIFSALVGKTVQSVRLVGNVGFGILGDPVLGDRQGDAITYGFSIARAISQGVEIVGDVNGRYETNTDDDAPVGTETRAAMHLGARFTHKTVRVDGGIILGMTDFDPNFGFTAGVTWVFRGFRVP